VIVSVRPEDIEVNVNGANDSALWKGIVRQVVYFGDSMNCAIDFAGTMLRARLHPSTSLEDGQEVTLNFKAERCAAFPPRIDGPIASASCRSRSGIISWATGFS
jgi:ABC-type sugar transport system ATPase subunit